MESPPRVTSSFNPNNVEVHEDENNSNPSTVKYKSFFTIKSQSGLRRICNNAASSIERDEYFNDDMESLSDFSTFDEIYLPRKPPLVTRISRISLSPEAEEKRKEAFNTWLKGVNAREREKKRLQRERMEAEKEKKLEEEELRREQSEIKIKKWMAKKECEAKEKLTRLNDLKKRSSEMSEKKPKELRKAIDFKQWLEKKNQQQKSEKQEYDERKKLVTNYRKCRESTSAVAYSRWKESSKTTPKPVPFGRGLESLRGSTTRMYMNPIPWKTVDEE